MVRLLLILISVLLTAACSRQNSNSTTLSIQTGSAKVASIMSSLPSGQKACYGVSVSGPGIDGFAGDQCSPATGAVAGFFEEGQSISLEVPQGPDRKIEIYVLLKEEGNNDSCDSIGSKFPTTLLKQIFLVGSAEGVTLDQPNQSVTVQASFPGSSHHIARNVPATCIAVTENPTTTSPSFRTTAGGGLATGVGIKLFGRIGTPVRGVQMTGPGLKLNVRKAQAD